LILCCNGLVWLQIQAHIWNGEGGVRMNRTLLRMHSIHAAVKHSNIAVS